MSDISKDVRTYLLTVSAVTDIVGSRIFPRMMPQGESLPAVVFSLIGSTSEPRLLGASGGVRALVQIDCYAETHIVCNNLAEKIRLSLHGYSGTAGSSTVEAMLDAKREMFDAPTDASDVPAYRVSLDFEIWHNEAIPSF